MKTSKLTPNVKAFGLVYEIKIDYNTSKTPLHKHNRAVFFIQVYMYIYDECMLYYTLLRFKSILF